MKREKLNLYESDLDDLNALYICSVRYALGRATYMPSLVQDFIMSHEDTLQKKTVVIMMMDIEGHKDSGYSFGMECDENRWKMFYAWLANKVKESFPNE